MPISTTILAVLGQIELHLTAQASSQAAADAVLEAAVLELQTALGPSVYSVDGRGLEAVVGDLLREHKLTIAVAESCTGGLLASRLTDVPGSSDYVDRGVVCYSNQAKIDLAGVPGGDHRAATARSASRSRRRWPRAFDRAPAPTSASASPGSPAPAAARRRSRSGPSRLR